ncbi:type VI secretion system tip protein VgrG, partial [Acidovorax sp. NPDC077693]
TVGKDYVLEVGAGAGQSAAGDGAPTAAGAGVENIVAPTGAPSGGEGGGGGGDAPSCIKIDATQIFLESKKIHLNAKDEILLTCGSSTIKLTPGQIEVLSPLDKLNC